MCIYIRRAGWGFSLICGLPQDKWPSKMGTYHWEGHEVFLMHICRVQSQVPFSGVCAHLRDLAKNGTGTYHWEVTGICVQTSDIYIENYWNNWKQTRRHWVLSLSPGTLRPGHSALTMAHAADLVVVEYGWIWFSVIYCILYIHWYMTVVIYIIYILYIYICEYSPYGLIWFNMV